MDDQTKLQIQQIQSAFHSGNDSQWRWNLAQEIWRMRHVELKEMAQAYSTLGMVCEQEIRFITTLERQIIELEQQIANHKP